MSARREFLAGVRDLSPALISLFPIAVVLGITAAEVGLTGLQTVWMSVGVYTGLAQAAMLDLIATGSPAAVVVLTGVLVNIRLLMYSASLAPYFRHLPARTRALASYLNVDTVYALSVATFQREGADHRLAYYLGAGVSSWVVWQAGTLAGLAFGDFLPDGLDLRFAIPLLFIALLVPVLEDRPSVGAAVAAGTVAVAGAGLPFDLGLVVGTVAGVLAGVLAQRRWSA